MQWQIFRNDWTSLRNHSNPELRHTTRHAKPSKQMHRATAELAASGIENRALKLGDHAPSFSVVQSEPCAGLLGGPPAAGSAGGQLLPRTLVTVLQHGAGGSTGNPFGSPSFESGDHCNHSRTRTLYASTSQKAEPELRHLDGSAPENRRAVSTCLHSTGLSSRALQVIRQHVGQIPR